MSFEVDSAYHTECSMKAIRNGYGLLSAAALLVLRLITSTGRLSINERQGSHIT